MQWSLPARRAERIVIRVVRQGAARTRHHQEIGRAVSTLSATFELPPTAVGIRSARRLVGELLLVWRAPHDPSDAALLVTELVANVVDHVGGGAPLSLELVLAGEWLRIAVVDGSAVRPVVRALCVEEPRGRGLRLVEAIADRWGCEDHEGGKRVWFELRPPM